MKTMAPNHPQLSLPFDSVPQVDSAPSAGEIASQQAVQHGAVASSAMSNASTVIVDFQTALSKRQAQTNAVAEAGLYRRILETVRNIG